MNLRMNFAMICPFRTYTVPLLFRRPHSHLPSLRPKKAGEVEHSKVLNHTGLLVNGLAPRACPLSSHPIRSRHLRFVSSVVYSILGAPRVSNRGIPESCSVFRSGLNWAR